MPLANAAVYSREYIVTLVDVLNIKEMVDAEIIEYFPDGRGNVPILGGVTDEDVHEMPVCLFRINYL